MAPPNRRLDPVAATGTIPKSNIVASCEQGPIRINENVDNAQNVFPPDIENMQNPCTSSRQNDKIMQPVSLSKTERISPNAMENLNNRLMEGDGTKRDNGIPCQR